MDNVYIGKDGRARVYIKKTNKQSARVMSYPKYLVEQNIGRELERDEQIHHKDGNPLNNDFDNLEIKRLGEHQREHNPVKYFDKMMICPWCGKEFLWTAEQQSTRRQNRNHRENRKEPNQNPFCSKSCAGKYGQHVQMKEKARMAK